MSKTELPDIIRIVLEQAENGATAEQLHQQLSDGMNYEVSKRKLKDTLREMHENDELDRFRVSDGTRGQPPYCYTLADSEDRDGEEESAETGRTESTTRLVGLRGDFPAEDSYDLPDGIYWNVVDRQRNSERLIEEVQEVAPELADENPVDLFVEMTGWAVDRLNELKEELGELLAAGRTDELRQRRDDYDEFAEWCDHYFRGFWRLTAYDDPGPDLLRIPESKDILDKASESEDLPTATYDEAAVRERYEDRVFGEKVVERVEINDDATDAVGTDASVAEVTLPSRARLGVDTNLEIFAGAAALQHEDRRFTDYDFNPTNLRDFRSRQAFRKGLIISRDATPQLGEGEAEHARYAAMDLRQYLESARIIDNEVDWQPHGDTRGELTDYSGPDVMYLDGRVTPLVHQLAQFTAKGMYGELVRREIRQFGKIVDYADADNWHTETVFAGIVKSPAISWFAPLVFWYLETKYKDGIADPSRIYRPPIPDVRLPHLLFVGLSEARGEPTEDEIFSTFRILRRFYDHSIPEYDLPPRDADGEMIDVDSREDWMSYFDRVQARKEETKDIDTIDREKFKTFRFAELCANVGTLMCYAGPPNLYMERTPRRTRLPRVEVLANPPRDMPEAMGKTLSIFGKNNYPDDAHAKESYESDVDDIDLIVPDVIVRSDEVAKEIRDILSTDIRKEIMRLVGALEGPNADPNP